MRTRHHIYWAFPLLIALGIFSVPSAQAQQDDPTIQAATNLLYQTTQNARNGRHNHQLRGLRQLHDADLSPLFEALLNSPHPTHRVHAILGLAEVSPSGKLDMARLIEVEDTQELTAILGAAIDDELLSANDLSQIAAWEGLDRPTRLIIAQHALAREGHIDASMLREPFDLPEGDDVPAAVLLHFGLASLMQMQLNQDAAHDALDRLNTAGQPRDRDATRAQLLALAVRDDFKISGRWALSLAADETNNVQLRFVALGAAMRFEPSDASILWSQWYAEADELTTSIRLALIALDAVPWASPALFQAIANSDNELLAAIGRAGAAAAGHDHGEVEAIESLLDFAHPPTVRWARNYGESHAADNGPAILSAVISAYTKGGSRSKPALIEQAILAVIALIENYPQEARSLLQPLLTDSDDGINEQIVLTGLLKSSHEPQREIAMLIQSIPEFENTHAQDLSLLLRLRSDAAMSDEHWDRTKAVIRGAGQLDELRRIQLAWHYLKHCNQDQQSLRTVIERAR